MPDVIKKNGGGESSRTGHEIVEFPLILSAQVYWFCRLKSRWRRGTYVRTTRRL